jgi:hypothetical protein
MFHMLLGQHQGGSRLQQVSNARIAEAMRAIAAHRTSFHPIVAAPILILYQIAKYCRVAPPPPALSIVRDQDKITT